MAVKDFALPDLGEGLTESELVEWKVAVGDTVRLNQIIAEVETAKALVELPAPYEGRVSRLYVEPGVTVAVGEPLVAFEVEVEAQVTATVPPDEQVGGSDVEAETAPEPVSTPADVESAPEPTLVGYGARPDSANRPARRARPGLAGAGRAGAGDAGAGRAVASASTASVAVAPVERPRATPPVRALARERGIDLASVTGTGDRGLITRHDLDALVVEPTGTARPTTEEVHIPIRGVRRATADAMVRSAFTAPQATVFLTVDVTPTTELVDRLRARPELVDARPGLLAVVAKALCLAVRRTPETNSRWDDDAQEIVQTPHLHLGIAAATPRGLLVPVIHDADALPFAGLAAAIRSLAQTARAGRTAPADLTGGTLTITNVGVFGVDAGTPILTPGEAVILAVGAVRRQPWEHDSGIALRDVLTLALTFDHRIVDGEQAARLLTDIGGVLSDPATFIALV